MMFVPENLFSLIIPCYNESTDVIEECLASVVTQQFFDFHCLETIIVVDGNHNLYVELEKCLHNPFFDKLNLKIIEQEENGGAGVARNAGIDAAKGEYVIFADCDDVYYNVFAFADMYKAVTENHGYPDYLWGKFIEEAHIPEIGANLVNHNDAVVWSFAKIIKRSILNEYHIRYLPDVRIYEDTYVCAMAYALAGTVTFLDSTLYFWRWHDNSTIRKNSKTEYYKRHKDILHVNTALVRDLTEAVTENSVNEQQTARAAEIIRNTKANTIIGCYTMELECVQLQPALFNYVKDLNKTFLKEHFDWYNPLDVQVRLGDAIKQKNDNGIIVNKGFDQWLNEMIER